SVKWLLEIRAQEGPFEGYFQKQRYVFPNDGAEPTPLRERGVRALITHPASGDVVPAGGIQVSGLTWSGNQPVQKVELSVDGGQTWRIADLEAASSPYSWQRWRATWLADRPGDYTLKARATDADGRVQPESARWNLLGYGNNGIQSVTIQVR